MKRSMTCLVILLLWGCGTTTQTNREEQKVPDNMALGWVDRAELEKPEFAAFKVSYDTASVGQEFVGLLQQVYAGIDYLVVLGTWCGDSRREVPKFLKIADSVGIPDERIRLYGVDRSKKSADGLAERYQIERVPTFIFLKNGREIGRITETPHISMEADMLSILAGAP